MPAATKATLKREIHDEEVLISRQCDYCGAIFEIDDPVQYDIIRIGKFPNLTATTMAPLTWHPDAARCHNCEIDTIDPATDGFDEALVSLTVTNSDRALRIDATSLTVDDYSPDGDGYYPPAFDPRLINATFDVGLVRWLRIEHCLAIAVEETEAVEILRTCVARSREVPPGIDIGEDDT